MTRAVGIDLGTTYTVVAVIKDGQPQIIPNAEGQRLTPSVVAFTESGKPLVGLQAKRQAIANPGRTVFSIKRHMGTSYKVKSDQRDYTPQDISTLILGKVKADTENYLGEKIDKAVITVPAYFNDRQRQATKEAGILAGLDVVRIISEPTAAALAYGLNREDIHTILVWDLGGGTFDVSILELGEGIFEVRAVSGNTWLGGDDYDQRIMDYLAQQCRKTYEYDYFRDVIYKQMLREAAEKAKIDLSTKLSTSVCIPFIERNPGVPVHFKEILTREKFQELTRDLLEKMIPPTRQAMADAGLEPKNIDRVILVGGSTRMPAVPELVRQLLGREPYQSINPDEAVALGAAIQAGMLLGVIDKAVLLDVIPLSLGIETQGGLFTRIIHRNTPLPASESRIFTTAMDYQTCVDIHVLQGERELVLDNISLGQFQLQDIPLGAKGMPKVEIAFDVDVDGIVHVSAKDMLTENEEKVKIVCLKELQPDDIQRIIAEAESCIDEDRQKRDRIAATIQANNVINGAEMALQEIGRWGREDREVEIEGAILKVKEALATGQSDRIILCSKELRKLLGMIRKEVPNSALEGSR